MEMPAAVPKIVGHYVNKGKKQKEQVNFPSVKNYRNMH